MTSSAPEILSLRVRGLAFPALAMGPADGPVVLCLHGYPDTRHGFFPVNGPSVGALLAGAGYRVVAPAMRGTEPECLAADGDYTPAALAADVLGHIDALGGRAVCVGNDWGALATYLAAAQAPDKVVKAVTLGIPHPRAVRFGPRLLWKARHMIAYQFAGHAAKRLRKNDLAGLERLYQRWSPTWSLPADALDEVKLAYRKPGVLEGALGPYRATRLHLREVFRQLAEKIRVPTLALYGGGDPSVPPASYERATRGFAAAYRWESIGRVGHFVHREDPTAVAERIIAFLREP